MINDAEKIIILGAKVFWKEKKERTRTSHSSEKNVYD